MVRLSNLDDIEIPVYRAREILFYERWNWSPSDFDGLPISERESLAKVLDRITANERKNMPTPPTSPAG